LLYDLTLEKDAHTDDIFGWWETLWAETIEGLDTDESFEDDFWYPSDLEKSHPIGDEKHAAEAAIFAGPH